MRGLTVKSSLHVCFMSQEYPPDTGWGGIGSYTYEMAHGLVEAGQRVTVITRAAEREEVLDDRGVQVHRIFPGPDWGRIRGMWRLNRGWPGFAWAGMIRFRQVHRSCPVDIVEAGECGADSLFVVTHRFRQRPRTIVRLHTARIFIDGMNAVLPDRRQRFIYWQERQAILRADALTAPSEAIVGLTRTWLPLQHKNVWVIPNPVNTAAFCPSAGPKLPEVLFVGRLERNKGMLALARALPDVLRRCPGVGFRFVGRDGVDEAGRSWRQRLLAGVPAAERSRVHFERVPRGELIHRYRQAELSVLASIWENFPYVLLEAMACGTPVVATRTGGVPEIVEDGVTGILVPSQDPVRLGDAISEIVLDPLRREEMGRNARARVERLLSVDRIMPKMLGAYHTILATG
jgi:glycogen(starch) synthase